jgi:alpha-tubulin suppressor-like RCC1 family protein
MIHVSSLALTAQHSPAGAPKHYAFTAADAGEHVFANAVIWPDPGPQTLRVVDAAGLDSNVQATQVYNVTGVFLGPHLDTACAAISDGSVKCWGSNAQGQLGLGDATDRGSSPNSMGDALPAVRLGSGRTVRSMSLGAGHVCALLDDRALKCWGLNINGQLGVGDVRSRGMVTSQMGDNLQSAILPGDVATTASSRGTISSRVVAGCAAPELASAMLRVPSRRAGCC